MARLLPVLAVLLSLSTTIHASTTLVQSCASPSVRSSELTWASIHTACAACLSANLACPIGCCVRIFPKYRLLCQAGSCCIAVLPLSARDAELAVYVPQTAASSTADPDRCEEPVDAPPSRCPSAPCAVELHGPDTFRVCRAGYELTRDFASGGVSNCLPTTAAEKEKEKEKEEETVATTPAPTTVAPTVTASRATMKDEEDGDGAGGRADDEEAQGAGGASGSGAGKMESEPVTCFPASATVDVENVGRVRMDALHVGDRVLTVDGKYSEVFMFSHRDSTHSGRNYVRVTLESGVSLTAAVGHHVYSARDVSGGLVTMPVEDVVVGSYMFHENVPVVVAKVEHHVFEEGLYNPHTLSGDMVVDGFLVSTYTKFVKPDLAHVALAPVRAAFGLVGRSACVVERIVPLLRDFVVAS